MIYFIVTACLIRNELFSERKQEYRKSLFILKELFEHNDNVKVIIVENTGKKFKTFLNSFGFDVYYTSNNNINTQNKGIKEIYDILECIKKYNIQDNDFIVKMTGRYYLNNNSDFINQILNFKNYDCIIRYGSYNKPTNVIVQDCITGLIGLKAKYIKQIDLSKGINNKTYPMEWEWAKVTLNIDINNIKIMEKLGIFIKPSWKIKKFFEV